MPGTLKGSRVLVNFFGGKRKNMTLGFPTDLSKLELSEGFRTNFMADLKRIPPRYVNDGPIFENVIKGDDDRRHHLPDAAMARGDGGRYIGTGCFNVMRDPDDGWINCGTYRVMIHDDKTRRLLHLARQARPHDARQVRGARRADAGRRGLRRRPDDLPDGLRARCRYGVCEYDIVGGMRGEPVDVDQGADHRPADPGQCRDRHRGLRRARQRAREGPFGEWTGYYASDVRPEPVIDIKAIYHRNDPILLGCVAAAPARRDRRYRAMVRSALLRENIEKAGVPDVAAAWAHEVGTARLLLGVAIKQRYPGHAKQAGHIAAMCHVGAYCGRYVIVVDDDIDVSNLDELIWAMLTRSDPATSIDIIRNAWSTPLDPRIEPERKAAGDYHQQPRHHRRLPAVALARQVPGGEHAEPGTAAAGAAEIRLPVQELIAKSGGCGLRPRRRRRLCLKSRI